MADWARIANFYFVARKKIQKTLQSGSITGRGNRRSLICFFVAPSDPLGLKRCGKSCRLRWINYLRPDIKHGSFTEDEETLIYKLHASIGSR